jgi:predicted transcriptional regulator
MSVVTVELPNALQEKLERIAQREGVSVSQLLIEAAEKLSQIEFLEQIKRDTAKHKARAAFEKVLAAVPDVEPENPDDRIKG